MKILVVCFANTCRSPVAEALLHVALKNEPHVDVQSRGLAGGVGETPEPMARALAEAGIEIVTESGTTLGRDEARECDLLLFLERDLLRESVVADPSLWPKSFTLREFARRGQINPPEVEHEGFGEWLAVLHAGRSRDELLGRDESDDVADPGLGGDEAAFVAMIAELQVDVARVAPLLSGWPSSEV